MREKSRATPQCTDFRDPEFLLVFATTVPKPDVDVLASFSEDSVEKESRYHEGELVTMGSMLLRVARIAESLPFEAPNVESSPIE